MPRAGGRPYECVRRAWHSDRHQPIRGSLIQEIFRIANEIHSPTTKKNKEWQEKLPIVVLKAEEIMYSKANSEVEYMDLKTLWERANDAINTIIRREEATEETGEFLQPCIEAALHLGCIPRRASRSQRNNQPRGYLSGKIDLTCAKEENYKSISSLAPHYSNYIERPNFVPPLNSCIISEMPFLSHENHIPMNDTFPSKSYPVYPLHYGVYSQPTNLQPNLRTSPASKSGSKEFLEMGITRELSLCIKESSINTKDPYYVPNNQSNEECDLSLRLGFGNIQEDMDANSNSSRGKNNVASSWHKSKGKLNLYREKNGVGSDTLDVELMARKRKASEQIDQQRYWIPKLMPSYSYGGTRTAGL